MSTQATGSGLGRDFWLFHSGQMISIVGDSCGSIALAWWILDVTGSPGNVSAVLGIALFVQTVLTPLLGPLGDRYSRKRLIVLADIFRCAMMGVLAAVAYFGAFSLTVVGAAYIPFVIGSALFNSSNMSIVPQLVPQGALQPAVRTSESIQAVGRVFGGIVAGVLVSWVGVAAAFLVDALSFAIAVVATGAVTLRRAETGEHRLPASFAQELWRGLQVIQRIPVLFWLCIAVAFFNLVFNPLLVLLPSYAKLAKGMPAWFLGAIESAMGAGIVAGAVVIAAVERRVHAAFSVIAGLVLLGGGIALLPWIPGIAAPLALMFGLGVGAAWTNIPISTRVAVAVPDQYRSRVNSIVAFLVDGTAPFGVAAAAPLIALLGINGSMTALGVAVLVAIPALFLIPGFGDFFRRPASELDGHFLTAYPHAFDGGSPRVVTDVVTPSQSPR